MIIFKKMTSHLHVICKKGEGQLLRKPHHQTIRPQHPKRLPTALHNTYKPSVQQ